MSGCSMLFSGTSPEVRSRAIYYYENKESFKKAVDSITRMGKDFIGYANAQINLRIAEGNNYINQTVIDNIRNKGLVVGKAINERYNEYQGTVRKMFDDLDMKKVLSAPEEDRNQFDTELHSCYEMFKNLGESYKKEAYNGNEKNRNLIDSLNNLNREDLHFMRDKALEEKLQIQDLPRAIEEINHQDYEYQR